MMPPSRLKQLLSATDLTPEAVMETLRANDCLTPLVMHQPERVTTLLEALIHEELAVRETFERAARRPERPDRPGSGMRPAGASIYDTIVSRLEYYDYLSATGRTLSRMPPTPSGSGPGWWQRLVARLRSFATRRSD